MFIFDSTFTINRSSGTKWTIPNSDVIWHLPVKGDTKTETAKVLQRAVLGCFCLWGLSAWNGLMGTNKKEHLLHPSIWIGLFYCCLRKATISWYIYIYIIFVTTSFRGKLFVCFCMIFDCLMSLDLIVFWIILGGLIQGPPTALISRTWLGCKLYQGRSNFKNFLFPR